jgi:hypothetical protein
VGIYYIWLASVFVVQCNLDHMGLVCGREFGWIRKFSCHMFSRVGGVDGCAFSTMCVANGLLYAFDFQIHQIIIKPQ